jgi:hypothetical protein
MQGDWPMALKDILVHVDVDKTLTSPISITIGLAQQHEARLTGLCFAIDPVIPAAILGMVGGSWAA